MFNLHVAGMMLANGPRYDVSMRLVASILAVAARAIFRDVTAIRDTPIIPGLWVRLLMEGGGESGLFPHIQPVTKTNAGPVFGAYIKKGKPSWSRTSFEGKIVG